MAAHAGARHLPDSLRSAYLTANSDSAQYRTGKYLYDYYEESNKDSALYYAQQCLMLARRNNKLLAEAYYMDNTAYQLIGMGKYAEALQYVLDVFKIVENPKIEKQEGWILFSQPFKGSNRLLLKAYTNHMFAILMRETQNTGQEIFHYKEARRIALEIGHPVRQMLASMNLGRSYTTVNKLDSALMFELEAKQMTEKSAYKKYLGQVYSQLGTIYFEKGDLPLALEYYHKGIAISKEENNMSGLANNYFFLSKYFLAKKDKDSALFYAMQNLHTIKQIGVVRWYRINLGTAYENVYLAYKMGNQEDSLLKYQELTLVTKDSLYKERIKTLTSFQAVTLNEQLRLQQVEKEKIVYQNNVRTYILIAGLVMLLLLAFVFYRNNLQKQKANKVLQNALHDLKSTQAQLIQSEKMASLGELTAGIAHEIQNPLNFVNNFSEVSKELIDEVNEELAVGKVQLAREITGDIKQNLDKIHHHGKRADAIVKGMLQHSQKSTGHKESTDINALCDEYLRLAYHGLRAKDNSFNASFTTNFDSSIGMVNVMPQEIGRVLLNLLNNAFYAVAEKSKTASQDYQPTVTVTTRRVADKVEISVADNGNGIPDAIREKIFQPFFTTKPTGQGTGLGLSLSYDIVQAHGGEIKIETEIGVGTTFIISL